MTASQQVNRIGKFIYRNLDGAFKFKTSSNMCDIYVNLYYQRKKQDQDYTKPDEYNDLHTMVLDLNITTYRNKVRVNIIECDEFERTIGFDLYEPESLNNLQEAMHTIFNKAVVRICKAYKDYDFVF